MIKLGIVGITGFELLKNLLEHLHFQITCLAANFTGLLNEIFGALKDISIMDIQAIDPLILSKNCDVVFCTIPYQASVNFIKHLTNLKIIDLSVDYRLNLDNYKKTYCSHQDIKKLKKAVYGLQKLNKQVIKKAHLVANPGCCPTCSILNIFPFLPFIEATQNIIIDAQNGTSGADKKTSSTTHCFNINENIMAYNPLRHRHEIEIQEKVSQAAKISLKVSFVLHFISVIHGMFCNSYLYTQKRYRRTRRPEGLL